MPTEAVLLPVVEPAGRPEEARRLRREYGVGYAVATLFAVAGVVGAAVLVMVGFGVAVGGLLAGDAAGPTGSAESVMSFASAGAVALFGLAASAFLRVALDTAAASRARLLQRALASAERPARRDGAPGR